MVELSPVAAAVLVVVGALGALPVVGITAGQTVPQADGANATAANGTVAPGQQLAAVIGVQQAGIEGEVAERAFGQRVAAAATNTSKASVVREEVEQLRDRLAELREERRDLREAHENGSISTGEYRAKLTKVHAKSKALKGQINATENVTEGLPVEALEAKGINASAIQKLKSDASNLTGPEVAEIARSIAGPNVGRQAVEDNAPPVAENASEGGLDRAENASERGPPGNDTVPGDGQAPPGNDTGPADDQGPPGNETAPSDGQDQSGNETAPSDGQDQSGGENAGEGGDNADSSGDNADSSGDDASGGGGGNSGGGGGNPRWIAPAGVGGSQASQTGWLSTMAAAP